MKKLAKILSLKTIQKLKECTCTESPLKKHSVPAKI